MQRMGWGPHCNAKAAGAEMIPAGLKAGVSFDGLYSSMIFAACLS